MPRGAAIEQEILSGSEDATADFAVYPVSRDFLPVVAGWPLTGEPRLNWIPASGGSRSQVVAAGDTLDLTIWDSSENSLLTSADDRVVTMENMRVSPNGTIFVPYVGETSVGGMTIEAARAEIQDAVEAIVPSGQVQLSLSAGRQNSVDLVGGVSAPGSIDMPDRNYSVMNLIADGGGVSGALENPQIRLVRGGQIYGTSIARLFSEPNLNTRLIGGDQVIVEEDRRYFLSLGAAEVQDQHLFSQDVISALDAVSIIGGVTPTRADPEGVLILREYSDRVLRPDVAGPSHTRVVFTLDLTTVDGLFSARNFRIHPGDLVLATESPVTSVRTVFGLIGSAFGVANQVDRF